jgi:Icc-related predicted phosphoesterase
MRVAAAGDLHFSLEQRHRLRPLLGRLSERADVLLLAGDLTQRGLLEEAHALAEELAETAATIPTVAVLGNHDYHAGKEDGLRRILEDVRVRVLEGEAVVLHLNGRRLGVAGAKGFGGGFAGACGTEFGEAEMKAFVHHTRQIAERLGARLGALSDCDIRLALTHYAPTKTTLLGEKLEIYPFLGSYLLGEAIDRVGADLAIHGHAHHGTERGVTPGGVPVRNVALPVIKVSYNVYTFGEEGVSISA